MLKEIRKIWLVANNKVLNLETMCKPKSIYLTKISGFFEPFDFTAQKTDLDFQNGSIISNFQYAKGKEVNFEIAFEAENIREKEKIELDINGVLASDKIYIYVTTDNGTTWLSGVVINGSFSRERLSQTTIAIKFIIGCDSAFRSGNVVNNTINLTKLSNIYKGGLLGGPNSISGDYDNYDEMITDSLGNMAFSDVRNNFIQSTTNVKTDVYFELELSDKASYFTITHTGSDGKDNIFTISNLPVGVVKKVSIDSAVPKVLVNGESWINNITDIGELYLENGNNIYRFKTNGYIIDNLIKMIYTEQYL